MLFDFDIINFNILHHSEFIHYSSLYLSRSKVNVSSNNYKNLNNNCTVVVKYYSWIFIIIINKAEE